MVDPFIADTLSELIKMYPFVPIQIKSDELFLLSTFHSNENHSKS